MAREKAWQNKPYLIYLKYLEYLENQEYLEFLEYMAKGHFSNFCNAMFRALS